MDLCYELENDIIVDFFEFLKSPIDGSAPTTCRDGNFLMVQCVAVYHSM